MCLLLCSLLYITCKLRGLGPGLLSGPAILLGALSSKPAGFFFAALNNTRGLRATSFARTRCSDEADRPRIEAGVAKAYGSLAAFESLVRTDVATRLEARCGTTGNFPFALAALPFLPYAWSSAADVLACDGVSCRERPRGV